MYVIPPMGMEVRTVALIIVAFMELLLAAECVRVQQDGQERNVRYVIPPMGMEVLAVPPTIAVWKESPLAIRWDPVLVSLDGRMMG